MRTGGLISDYLGEPRCEELRSSTVFGPGALRLSWQGGGTVMGSPLGLPIGKDRGISFQVYVDTQFQGGAWANARTVPIVEGSHNWCEVIPIATHLRGTDQHHVCENMGGDRARITWAASGSDDISEYRLYSNGGSGAVSYATTYATVPAKPGGVAQSNYTYESPRLVSGTWVFGIRGVDTAGNIQTSPTMEASCTVARVPEPPSGLDYEYDVTSNTVTLNWTVPANWL